MEIKSFQAVDIKASDSGMVEAIVSVFNNIDSYNERVMPGAFTVSLARKLPKGVWMHDQTKPVAKTIAAKELNPGAAELPESLKHLGGLWIKSQFNLETQRGREAFSDIKNGIIDEFSIGYQVEQDDFRDGVRELKSLKLIEWSPVLVGANPATAIVSAKSLSVDCSDSACELERIISRIKAHFDMKLKEGRVLSTENSKKIKSLLDALRGAVSEIETLLASAEPKKAMTARIRLLQLQQTIRN
jgi:HK97 family phage prohead protease